MIVLVTESSLILFNPVDCSPPGSSVHGILQARIVEWVAIPFSRDLPDPGIEPGVSNIAGELFTTSVTRKPKFAIHRHRKIIQRKQRENLKAK